MSNVYLTTTTAIAGFEMGRKLHILGDAAKYLRALTKEAEGITVVLTDDRLSEGMKAISQEDKTADEWETEVIDWIKKENGSTLGAATYTVQESNEVAKDTANAYQRLASSIAAKLSDELVAELDDAAAKKLALDLAPRGIYLKLLADIGDDGMASLPVPGSTRKHGNLPPDVYKYKALDIETNTVKTIRESILQNIDLGTKVGAAIDKEVRGLRAAKNKSTDAPKEYSSLGKTQINSLLKAALTKQNTRRLKFKQAVSLWQAMHSINNIDDLKCEFMKYRDPATKKLDYVTSPACIIVKSVTNDGQLDVFTVAQLLQMKPEWCTPENIIKEGSAFAALKVSASREADKNNGDGRIKSTGDAVKVVASFANFMDHKDSLGSFQKYLLDKKNVESRKAFVDLTLEMIVLKDLLWDEYQRDVLAEQQAKRDADAAAAKAGAAKTGT